MSLSALPIFIIAFFSSVIGSICGIGGGVIIKPVIDLLSVMPIDSGSFASGMTVLSMSCFSIASILISRKDIEIKWSSSVPIAIGAILGGVLGKELFSTLFKMFAINILGAIQSVSLTIVTLLTIVYSINKDKIRSLNVNSICISLAIGLVLGGISSFLGIGGGPMNLAVLCYFFSMSNKQAAQNSLLIICFSQIAGLISNIATSSVPDVNIYILIFMMLSGVTGACVGRMINARIDDRAVGKCFIALLIVIMVISTYNVIRYMYI